VLPAVGLGGRHVYAAASGGTGGGLVEIDVQTGERKTIVEPSEDIEGQLVVLSWSASGESLLQSFCSSDNEYCVAAIVRPGESVTLLEGTFHPVAATDGALLGALDGSGSAWGIREIASGKVTPLDDPMGLVRRPISSARALDDSRFLVDAFGRIVIIDANRGTVTVVLEPSDRDGWRVGPVLVPGEFVILFRESTDTHPTLSDAERRSVGILNVARGTVEADVLTLPVAAP